jgi:hypothetical protein
MLFEHIEWVGDPCSAISKSNASSPSTIGSARLFNHTLLDTTLSCDALDKPPRVVIRRCTQAFEHQRNRPFRTDHIRRAPRQFNEGPTNTHPHKRSSQALNGLPIYVLAEGCASADSQHQNLIEWQSGLSGHKQNLSAIAVQKATLLQ